jgi:hypothetical protein
MIVNIAGTSGAGKTHVMRALLKKLGKLNPEFIEGREHPIGSIACLAEKPVYIVGSYHDAHTGGCDTIKDVSNVFDIVSDQQKRGAHVLYEGLFVMNMQRGPQLAAQFPGQVHVFLLTTPISKCKEHVNLRRSAKGQDQRTDWKETEGSHKRAISYAAKMAAAGARVHRVSSSDAAEKVLDLLKEGR